MTDNIVDYSPHVLELQHLLRKVHDECMAQKFEDAYDTSLQIIAEGRLLRSAITVHQERKPK